MNKLISLLLILIAGSANAYEIWSASGVSDTVVLANSKDGGPALQQDMIGNARSPQTTRQYGFNFGHVAGINNTRCDVWEGPTCIYVFPAAAQQMALSSASANDTLAGTGCQKVQVHYLDNGYHPQSEIISLNGVTAVNTVATNILRINLLHCIQVGSGGTAAGAISLKNVTGTVTYDIISAGFADARQSIYTVPAGMYGYVSHWQASRGSATGTHFTQITLQSTSHDGTSNIGAFLAIDENGTLNGGVVDSMPIPVRIAPTSDVKCSAVSDASNANVTVLCEAMGWLENQ